MEASLLFFTLERHGATVRGSTRATLQRWQLNIDTQAVECFDIGQRQVSPRSKSLDLRPIAFELANLIVNKSRDPRLQWSTQGYVRIFTGMIIGDGFKQTIEGRRKRLNKELSVHLNPYGWKRTGAWWKHSQQ